MALYCVTVTSVTVRDFSCTDKGLVRPAPAFTTQKAVAVAAPPIIDFLGANGALTICLSEYQRISQTRYIQGPDFEILL